MRRLLVFACLPLAAVTTAPSDRHVIIQAQQPQEKDPNKSDLQLLQGTWVLVACITENRLHDDGGFIARGVVKMWINRQRLVQGYKDPKGEKENDVLIEWSFTIDASKSPKHLN